MAKSKDTSYNNFVREWKKKDLSYGYKLHKKEYDNVIEDIMTNGYDVYGPYKKKLEDKMKSLTGRKHAFMVSSGTAAIKAAIFGLDLFDKKVAVSSYNYNACVNQYQTFCKPIYVDCDVDGMIDFKKIPKSSDAVMLVNYNGNVVDYDRFKKLKYPGKVIVDCSQSFGSTYNGKLDGFFGDVAVFSFSGQKPIATRGYLGCIVTNDDKVAYKIDCAINQGKSGEIRNMATESIGFRGIKEELQCGLTYVAMKHWRQHQAKRTKIAKQLIRALKDTPIRIVDSGPKCKSSYSKFMICHKNMYNLAPYLRRHKINVQYTYLDNWNYLWGDGNERPNTDMLIDTSALVAMSISYTQEDVDHIVKTIKQYFKKVDRSNLNYIM